MEIYIEYALIENFIFDGVLLYLSLKIARAEISLWRIVISAIFGAVFAVVYPLLTLPTFLGFLLKISVGFLLCLIPFKRIKTKNERGMYALTCIFFFVFSFSFGGVLLALTQDFFDEKVPTMYVMTLFCGLTLSVFWLIRKLYAKRAVERYIYACEITVQGQIRQLRGFWDSGNLAQKHGIPICFLSPDIFYELAQEEIFKKGEGQVLDELQIQTMSGVKRIQIYAGEIRVLRRESEMKKMVYFAPSRNMIGREYSLLLPSGIFDEEMAR